MKFINGQQKMGDITYNTFSFDVSYGHRVAIPTSACTSLHGHHATVNLYFDQHQAVSYEQLNWFNKFLQGNINRNFIVDINDPWFNNIVNLEPMWSTHLTNDGTQVPFLTGFKPRVALNTSDEDYLRALHVHINRVLAGYRIDTYELAGCEREFFNSFFVTQFIPTADNLSQWIYKIINAKMSLQNVQVSRVDWVETVNREIASN